VSGGQPRQLANPPIREAVVEFRFAHSKDPGVEDLVPKSPTFLAEFPHRERIMEGTFNVKVSTKGLLPMKPKSTARGYRYFTRDRGRAVAMTASSMAYSRFAGYESRDTFLPEARAILPEYLACVADGGRDSRVTRIGVRFINAIALPTDDGENVNLDAIFTGLPQPILDEPITLLGVDRHTRSPTTGERSRVRLHGPVADEHSGEPVFVLDIDVWKDLDLSVLDEDAMATVLTDLFDLRSRLFFGSLHDSFLARYE
jgi:uncharacterized protein (TIGR04255 family)